jgi:hypothetical protein
VVSKEIGLEVNADKSKYIVMSQDQMVRRSHSIKIYSNFFERVEEFKCLGTNLTIKILFGKKLRADRHRWDDNIKMWDVGYGLDQAGHGQGQVAGTCDCGNEPLGSIKCGEFLD